MVSLSNSDPKGKLTIGMVKDSLFNEEIGKRIHGMTISSTNNEVLIVESTRRSGHYHSCR